MLNTAFESAQKAVPGWKSISITVPQEADVNIPVSIDEGTGGQPQLRQKIEFDLAGTEVKRERYSDGTMGQRTRSFMRFAHTGEYFGIVGQTIAGLASLGTAFLVYTGLALSIRRFIAWIGRKRRLA